MFFNRLMSLLHKTQLDKVNIKTTNEIGPLIRNPKPKTSHIDIGMIKSNKIDFFLFKMIFNNKYC